MVKYNKSELKKYLTTGEAAVLFTKVDGTTRSMRCTLKEGIVPEIKGDGSKKENPEVLAVWDLEQHGWRSFRLDSISSVDYIQ
jgi:hypothetical protein